MQVDFQTCELPLKFTKKKKNRKNENGEFLEISRFYIKMNSVPFFWIRTPHNRLFFN